MATRGSQYSLFESAEPIQVESSAPVGPATERRFSDYVVYVDESGDHSLASIDAGYPVFVLALCVFHKRHYSEKVIPAIEKLKFNYFGHDSESGEPASTCGGRVPRQEGRPRVGVPPHL